MVTNDVNETTNAKGKVDRVRLDDDVRFPEKDPQIDKPWERQNWSFGQTINMYCPNGKVDKRGKEKYFIVSTTVHGLCKYCTILVLTKNFCMHKKLLTIVNHEFF